MPVPLWKRFSNAPQTPTPEEEALHAWLWQKLWAFAFKHHPVKPEEARKPLWGDDVERFLKGIVTENKTTASYAGLLTHALCDAGLVPRDEAGVDAALDKLVSGRTAGEIGARQGTFLKFLQSHGARLIGTTDDARVALTRHRLGSEAIIVPARAQDAWKVLPPDVRMDFLFSLNLFEKDRWGKDKSTRKPASLLENVARAAHPATRVYVAPSVDDESALRARDIARVARKGSLTTRRWTPAAQYPEIKRDTYAFQPHERYARRA